jgi:hypothetical protein
VRGVATGNWICTAFFETKLLWFNFSSVWTRYSKYHSVMASLVLGELILILIVKCPACLLCGLVELLFNSVWHGHLNYHFLFWNMVYVPLRIVKKPKNAVSWIGVVLKSWNKQLEVEIAAQGNCGTLTWLTEIWLTHYGQFLLFLSSRSWSCL